MSQGQAAAPRPLRMGFRDSGHLPTAEGHLRLAAPGGEMEKMVIFCLSFPHGKGGSALTSLWWAEELLPA